MIAITPSDAASTIALKSLLAGYASSYGLVYAPSDGPVLTDTQDFAGWQAVLADIRGRFARWNDWLDQAFASAGVSPGACGGFPPADVYALGRCASVWANFVHAASTFSLTVDAPPPDGGGQRVLVNNPPGTAPTPWYRDWKAWFGIGGGALALVGGALAIRKTRGSAHARPAMAEGLGSSHEEHEEAARNAYNESEHTARAGRRLNCPEALERLRAADMYFGMGQAHEHAGGKSFEVETRRKNANGERGELARQVRMECLRRGTGTK